MHIFFYFICISKKNQIKTLKNIFKLLLFLKNLNLCISPFLYINVTYFHGKSHAHQSFILNQRLKSAHFQSIYSWDLNFRTLNQKFLICISSISFYSCTINYAFYTRQLKAKTLNYCYCHLAHERTIQP